MLTVTAAIVDARTGPLVSPFVIGLIGLAFIATLVFTARPNVRRRYPNALGETAVLAALSLIHLLFFWQPYRTGALVPKGGGDLASFFYPIHAFAAREVQDGRMPFWNPHLFSGAPHLANFQTGTLYPPNLIAYVLARPFEYATVELLALAHYLLASYGGYWLARAFGTRRPAAVLTGALYAYSGFLVAHLGHYSMLATAAWLPLVLAAIVGAVRHASWPIAVGGAFALACAVLGGHQPILLLMLTMATAVALFELWRLTEFAHPRLWRSYVGRREPLTAHVARLAVTAIGALGLSAPALGPSFELTSQTVRSELDYARASQFAVEPVALLHLVTPTVFGSNPTDYWGAFSSTETWGYTGVLALALAAYGFVVRSSRTRLFWLLVAGAAILFALGPFASIHGWAYAFVPGFDRIRAAGRGYMVFDLAVALLAGFGLDALRTERTRWSPRQLAATRWGIAGLGALLAIVVGFVIPLLASRVLGSNDPGNRPVIALDNVTMLAIWLALGLGVAVAIWRGVLRDGALVGAVIVVLLLDLFHATAPFNPTTEPILAGFQHQQVVDFIKQRQREDGPFRVEIADASAQPDLPRLAGFDDISGLFDPLALADYDEYRRQALEDRGSEQYRKLNVRYVLADEESVPPGSGYTEAFRSDAGVVLWEAPSWRPRAWLEGSDATRVTVTSDSPNSLTIALPADSPGGTLVVSQNDYPGWSAEVGGGDVAIGAFNGTLQSVEVPAGVVTVEMSFRPTRWSLWLGIAILAALGLIVIFVLSLRGRRTGLER